METFVLVDICPVPTIGLEVHTISTWLGGVSPQCSPLEFTIRVTIIRLFQVSSPKPQGPRGEPKPNRPQHLYYIYLPGQKSTRTNVHPDNCLKRRQFISFLNLFIFIPESPTTNIIQYYDNIVELLQMNARGQ